MTIRALIVDDEAPARRRLRDLLDGVADVEVVGECADGAEAIEAITRESPDLLFLDVQMPEINGFDVLDTVGAAAVPAVVFVSAFDAHAVRAFDHRALDYLLKPFAAERFHDALDRVRKLLSARPEDLTERIEAVLAERARAPRRVPVRSGGGVRLLSPGEIGWIETDGNYTVLHTDAGVFRTRATLRSFAERLAPDGFLRIHRSYLVNAAHVVELGPWDHGERVVHLRDGTSLVSSRSHVDTIRRLESF